MDDTRTLLGDLAGNLSVLVLKIDERSTGSGGGSSSSSRSSGSSSSGSGSGGMVVGIHVQMLGVVNSPHTISYLDNG